MGTFLGILTLLAGAGVLYYAFLLIRERPAAHRLAPIATGAEEEEQTQEDDGFLVADPWSIDWITRWLYLAGIRKPGATTTFIVAQIGCVLGGWLMKAWLTALPAIGQAGMGVEGMGGAVFGLVRAVPWITFITFSSLPILYVRGERQKIVESIDKDLPVTLELMATLGRGGLGLDASITRILEAQDVARPLAKELRTFQVETLAGVSRVECFRRLAARLDHSAVSIFVSSLIQAESVGSALGETLRRQADSLWSRRREIALMKAQTLPVKLSIPLVVCFLPPIYIFTLGPPFLQFLDSALANIN